ncbi:PPR domain protein [Rhizoctonia solani AG-3 Rhs1AP]|uniref:PPR domain protein n=2 Tax=Rhizoctonia solani AG-3 TaxID=1086053 RepID=A0A074S3A1_9AGAM|nr:PPR domain protein [Rhizoctonia solani AG-3 Rhs1AP]KEP53816.1 PPR domain protein [Rhizoctonia solani 123E]
MLVRVGRRIRQLISQPLCTRHLAPTRLNLPRPQCLASTTASPPKLQQKLTEEPQEPQEQAPRPPLSPEEQTIRKRITSLLSAPTNAETEKELIELRNTPLSAPKLICLLAEALVHHAYIPDAVDLISQSRKNGMDIPPGLYESVAFRLARRDRWAEILTLLEPIQSLSPSDSKKTKHTITTRLCEWRVRACAEIGDFAGMERALGMFPHGIPQRAWKVAEQACWKNSDPRTAAKIREVLALEKRFREKDKGPDKWGVESREELQLEETVQALVHCFNPQASTLHNTITIRIARAPQASNQRPTYTITKNIPSTSSHTPDPCHSFIPDTRLATRCVHMLVKNDRVTEAATMVAAMCKGTHSVDGTTRSIPQTSTYDAPPLSLAEIFASVRPDIHVFNSLLKGVLNTRGLSGMLALLEIMHDVDVRPDAQTAALLLRYLDRQRAWSPGRLIDTLVDLTAPIPKDYNNEPGVPPKPQPVPVSIRHTNVLLSSILHAERDASLGGGWKGSAAFLKYRNRPIDRWSPSDARLTSSPDNIDPPTAGLKLRARADSLKPVLQALRARGARNDSMAYALRVQRDGVVRLDPETGRQVLQRADIVLSDYHFSALMAGLVECGYMDSAKAVMKSAHEGGFGVGSPVMYTILITGYGRMGLARQAERVFKLMILAKVKPDAIAVDALAGAWFISGEYQRARQTVLQYWPREGELPFSEDTPLKKMVTELRKLRPSFKIRQKATQVSGEEDAYVGPIIQAIKAPDKYLPPAPNTLAGEKKDNNGPNSRRYSSIAGVGLQLDGIDWTKSGGIVGESGSNFPKGQEEQNPRVRARIMSSLSQNG